MFIKVELPELLTNFSFPETCTLDDVAGLFAYLQEANEVKDVGEKMIFIPKLDIQGLIPILKYKLQKRDLEGKQFINLERIAHLTGNNVYHFMALYKGQLREYRVPTTENDIYPNEREIHLAMYDFVLDNPQVLAEFN